MSAGKLDNNNSEQFSTINEKPLHRDLKLWLQQPGDLLECAVGAYKVDIVRKNLLIEIQTRNFASLKRKLAQLLQDNQVRLVYPIPRIKWIIHTEEDGSEATSRRKSPKQGSIYQVFEETVRITPVLKSPNLILEVLFTEEEEIRWPPGASWRWQRRGWSTRERRLVKVVESHIFQGSKELANLLPDSLEKCFTTDDIAKACGIKPNLSRQMAYTLRKIGAVDITGKKGNAILYSRIK